MGNIIGVGRLELILSLVIDLFGPIIWSSFCPFFPFFVDVLAMILIDFISQR